MALDSISSLTPDPVANVPSGRYVIITPARNEGLEIEQTIQSVLRQTVLPSQWVIVDDGSTDGTGAVIDRYAQRYAWITALHRRDRGVRHPGAGVIEAFEEGVRQNHHTDWADRGRRDADLGLEQDYVERCVLPLSSEPKGGTDGGT